MSWEFISAADEEKKKIEFYFGVSLTTLRLKTFLHYFDQKSFNNSLIFR